MEGLKEALKNRRGKSIDLTITIEANPAKEEKPEMEMEGEEPMDQHEMDEMMTSDMSDYDKEAMIGEKPKSLGDRARMEALMRSKKGK